MKKTLILSLFLIALSSAAHSQLMVSKLIGKNSGNSSLGWGVFAYWEFPLANTGNNGIRIELMDFAYYPRINSEIDNVIGYISIKAGYKHVFSEDQTGFYIEPSAGWARVVVSNQMSDTEKGYGDGLALGLEGGYSLGVGQGGNTVNFGLKYESDLAGAEYTANSIGFRVSFSLHLLHRKDNY
jgi:hypothetical protein